MAATAVEAVKEARRPRLWKRWRLQLRQRGCGEGRRAYSFSKPSVSSCEGGAGSISPPPSATTGTSTLQLGTCTHTRGRGERWRSAFLAIAIDGSQSCDCSLPRLQPSPRWPCRRSPRHSPSATIGRTPSQSIRNPFAIHPHLLLDGLAKGLALGLEPRSPRGLVAVALGEADDDVLPHGGAWQAAGTRQAGTRQASSRHSAGPQQAHRRRLGAADSEPQQPVRPQRHRRQRACAARAARAARAPLF